MEISTKIFSSIEEIIKDLKSGKIVCLADNENLENEIDMVCLAEFATPDNISYMAKNGCGFICCVIPAETAVRKNIHYMKQNGIDKDKNGTPWACFIDSKNCKTGISPEERSKTIIELTCTSQRLDNFVNGHVPVLIAKRNLLDERQGHTEGSSLLSTMCGSNGCAVICEILEEGDKTSMLRVKDFEDWNKDKNLKLYTIDKLC